MDLSDLAKVCHYKNRRNPQDFNLHYPLSIFHYPFIEQMRKDERSCLKIM